MDLQTHPLTPARWADFARLFRKSGACAGCCRQWWRLQHAQWVAQNGAGDRRTMRLLVKSGKPTGVLTYAAGRVAGWCAVAPRAEYGRLANSLVLQPVDDQPVWSVTCFFVALESRRRGFTGALLNAATDFAHRCGAQCLEGYPTEPAREQADAFVYTGLASAFRRARFREVARRSPRRPIFRRRLHPTRSFKKKS